MSKKINPQTAEIVRSLEEFRKALESGFPINYVEVRREETPDGPMHIRTKKKGKLTP